MNLHRNKKWKKPRKGQPAEDVVHSEERDVSALMHAHF